MVDLYRPGIESYVKRVQRGPFSLVRYGDGEWKVIVPGIPRFPPQQIVFKDARARARVRWTVTNCHQADNYLMATCDLKGIRLAGQEGIFETWVAKHVPDWVVWRDSRVFRRAAIEGRLYPLLQAIRRQSLPVVLIGPEHLGRLRFSIDHHIVVPGEEEWPKAWQERGVIAEKVLAYGKPAFFSFSVGTVSKVLIWTLWPWIGSHSFLVDFGSLWDGLCGLQTRFYHAKLTASAIRKNLRGG